MPLNRLSPIHDAQSCAESIQLLHDKGPKMPSGKFKNLDEVVKILSDPPRQRVEGPLPGGAYVELLIDIIGPHDDAGPSVINRLLETTDYRELVFEAMKFNPIELIGDKYPVYGRINVQGVNPQTGETRDLDFTPSGLFRHLIKPVLAGGHRPSSEADQARVIRGAVLRYIGAGLVEIRKQIIYMTPESDRFALEQLIPEVNRHYSHLAAQEPFKGGITERPHGAPPDPRTEPKDVQDYRRLRESGFTPGQVAEILANPKFQRQPGYVPQGTNF